MPIASVIQEYQSLIRRNEQMQAEQWFNQKCEEKKKSIEPPQVMDSKGNPVKTSTVNQSQFIDRELKNYFENLLPKELRKNVK